MSISSFFLVQLLLASATTAVLLILLIKWRQQYWKRKGLPYLEPDSLFGNIGNPFGRKAHLAFLIQNMYNEIKKLGAKHGGVYSLTKPVYIPVHPNMLKNVMLKDFHYFQDRDFYYNDKDDPISSHLFAISGSKWRNLRTKLSSTFSSGKMKAMFDTIFECAQAMQSLLLTQAGNKEGFNIKDVLERYTIDIIGSCAFGLECNSFKDENAEFRKHGRSIFKPLTKVKRFLNLVAFSKPELARKLGYRLFPDEISSFFRTIVNKTINYRQENDVRRNDLLQILIDLKNRPTAAERLTENEIAAQVFGFFVAGFETSSTAMTFCLYELALNPEIQTKVRNEVNYIYSKYKKLTYEAIMDMKYTEQVINETLRKYPPLPLLTRTCVEDYHVPDTEVVIEKGTKVFIPILGFHYDPEYFPNPNTFDPERFSEASKSEFQSFTHIPFGEGPRTCIAMRFGILQMKIGLAVILKNYIVTLNEKTLNPIRIDCHGFVLAPKKGVFVNIESIPDDA